MDIFWYYWLNSIKTSSEYTHLTEFHRSRHLNFYAASSWISIFTTYNSYWIRRKDVVVYYSCPIKAMLFKRGPCLWEVSVVEGCQSQKWNIHDEVMPIIGISLICFLWCLSWENRYNDHLLKRASSFSDVSPGFIIEKDSSCFTELLAVVIERCKALIYGAP